MALEKLIDQERARRILESMVIESRLPHALLFWGPSGVGKSVAAIELARWLNCAIFPQGPCGECPSCTQFRNLEHPHFKWLFPLPRKALKDPETGDLSDEGARNVAQMLAQKGQDPYRFTEYQSAQFILIGQIRSLIQWATVKTFTAKPRVALIERADRLKEEAGNALLKLLEEPPSDFFLILTVETPEDILDTLRSRCHAVEFNRLLPATIAAQLKQRGFEDAEEAGRIAQVCGGSLSAAQALVEHPQKAADLHQLAVQIVRHSLGKSPLELDRYLEKWNRQTHSERLMTLDIITAWLRDAAVLQALGQEGEPRIIYADELDLLKKFIANCPDADFIAATRCTEQTRQLLESNVLPPLALVMLARKLYTAVYQRRPI